MIAEGAGKFEKQLRMNESRGTARSLVERVGMAGTIARGIVFAIAGLLVVDAAATADPRKSTGLDGTRRTLTNRSYSPWLLGACAIGLIAFGVRSRTAA